ncbi:MAG: PAS domain S-box protein [Salinivirgaceae bacterium]
MKTVLRILIVEDSEDDSLLVLRQIKKGGYYIEYERVETSDKMKVAIEQNTWDIILSDYHLPHFNGLDALWILKESGVDIPFIIISGAIGEDTAVEAMKAGANDYIMKNNMHRLLPAIERELRECKNRTERKHLEQKQKETEALKITEDKFKILISDLHVGVLLVNAAGEIVIINNTALELFELTENQISGKYAIPTEWEINFEDGYKFQGFPELFQKVMTTHIPIRNYILSVYRPKKGNRIWLFADAVPEFDSNGELYQVVWTFIDRTERKNAVDALRESEDRYRRLVELSPDGIAIHQQGKIVYINTEGIKQFGAQNLHEIIGKPILDLVHPDYRDAVVQRIGKTLDGLYAPYTEEKFVKLDGTVFDAEVTAIPSVYEGKPATQVVVHDITERKLVEAEIKFKNQELIKLNAEKDKFFSIIAHDLRSPFSGLLGLTEIMVEKTPSYPIDKIQSLAVTMRDSATNLFRLLENLLHWARQQQGLIPYNPELISLSLAVNESMVMVIESAKNKEIEITYDIPENIHILADSNMLQTIIRNLASNAIKFTPKGGKIYLQAKTTHDNNVVISIKDTGIGMDSALINNLFKLDVSTNREGTEGETSTGLGLLLCKEFIEKHGGKIWVESQEADLSSGKVGGTTFYFTLKT